MKKAVFFDLFFTLANLEYQSENEFTLLNISRHEWEASAENADVYRLRATGKIKTEKEPKGHNNPIDSYHTKINTYTAMQC